MTAFWHTVAIALVCWWGASLVFAGCWMIAAPRLRRLRALEEAREIVWDCAMRERVAR